MNDVFCEKEICVNYKSGFCKLRDPEKYDNASLDFEDVADALRLKIVVKKGSLYMPDE